MYLGHQIDKNQKIPEANRFVAKKMINTVDIENLTAEQYRLHYSNICVVLDIFLLKR